MKHKGFTIVELLIVLVVIAILATIAIVSYSYMRDDGIDTKIRSVVKTVGDALLLAENDGIVPSSPGYVTNPTTGLDAVLVPNYLKQGYRDGLSSKHAAAENRIILWQYCRNSSWQRDGFIIYAALNNPTDEDRNHFAEVHARCRVSSSNVPTTGPTQYNYAQKF